MADLRTNGRPWRFFVLADPSVGFTLEGACAPHGRPRKKAIVETEFELRQTETYNAGVRIPTRHITGDKESNIVLVGRLSDRALGGPGTANDKLRDIKEYFAKGLQTVISWGQVLTYLATPGRCKFGRESEGEIPYELTFLVDADADLAEGAPRPPVTTSPKQSVPALRELSATITKFVTPPTTGRLTVSPDFYNAMADAVSQFNSASAELLAVADVVDDYASATSAQIRRLLGGIGQYETALQRIESTMNTFSCDIGVAVHSVESDLDWYGKRMDAQEAAQRLVAQLVNMSRDATASSRGGTNRAIVAAEGDTWESIATRELGSPSKASVIRDANGALYGEQPLPGRRYLIPVDS